MTEARINLIKKLYNIETDNETISKTERFIKLFVEYNSHTNLMSKNDVEFLFEKHIIDSLSVVLFDKFLTSGTILDVGCGGGFPSVILSIFYPDKNIIAMDSVAKKINFINYVKSELKLLNLRPMLTRVEDYPPLDVDIAVNRAVGKIKDIWKYSKKHLKTDGYFISYKAKTAETEAYEAAQKYAELCELNFIKYNLPLDENYTRELVIFKNRTPF